MSDQSAPVGPGAVPLDPADAHVATASASDANWVFVETLDKHDGLRERHRFLSLPIGIGTAYRNDLILDGDDHRDGLHSAARIVRGDDGGLWVEALDGAPDLWAPGGKTRRWRVDGNASFIVGGQRLRVRTADFVPAPAPRVPVLRGVGSKAWLWALPLALVTLLFEVWIGDLDGERQSVYLTTVFSAAMVLALWAGAWALVSRLTGRVSHFLTHLALAAMAVVALFVLDYAFDTLAFSFNLAIIQKYDYALVGLVIGALVWCHAFLVVRTHARTAAVAAVLVGGALFAFQALGAYNQRGSLASSSTLSVLRPPSLRVATGHSSAEFFSDTATLKLRQRAESSRPEKPEGNDYSFDE
ncbi:MAG: hypothetical protein JNL19_04000 [Burkholderiales bacterium]|nr:hypothetical protein [Burkholderiales bacterium]